MPSIISASTTSGTALNFTADTSGVLALQTGATPTTAVTINTSQLVGIGTTSPAQTLHVSGNTRLDGNVESNAAQYIYSWAGGSSGQVRSGIYLDGTNQVTQFFTATNERMRIDSSGRVQIGAANPATAQFSVQGGAGSGTVAYFGSSNANLTAMAIRNDPANNTTMLSSEWSSTATNLLFGIGGTERMRIDTSGNVGIGSTSLAATFTVNSVSQGNGNQGVINRIRNNHYVGYASRAISGNTDIFQVGPFPPNNAGGGGAIVRIVVGGVKGGIDFHGSVYEYMVVKSGQNALTINTVHNFGITGVTSTVSGNYAIFGLNFTNYSGASMTFEVLCGAAANQATEYILTPTFV